MTMVYYVRAALAAIFILIFGGASSAQDDASWIQIEAQSGVGAAQRAAAGFARRLDGIAGFRLGASDWHAIVIGPFPEAEALARRRQLRAANAIPGDAFITDGQSFRAQFWPPSTDGGATDGAPTAPSGVTSGTLDETEPPGAIAALAEPATLPDETRGEALQSERLLTAQERRGLQIALQWAGFYTAAIDGAFGRGTRGSMAAWQAARGYDDTGVLTTLQRAALIADYNAVLEGLEFRVVTDTTAGISVKMPTALVAFDRYEPPFAHYAPKKDGGIHKVLLISQRGDRANLYGLYDIMQTLEIVPQQGPREKRRDGFTLIGDGNDFISQTEARLSGGQVKGFTLIWPKGDEERRARVIADMVASLTLDPSAVMGDMVGQPSENQSIDLLAGLQIRKPSIVRSGFYVTRTGDVLTTADAAQSCGRITLNNDVDTSVTAVNTDLGLALLKPDQLLAPRSHAAFQGSVPRLKSRAVLAGYSFDGALGAPSLSFGEVADLRGLNGEDDIKRFALSARGSDAGGPVLDATGAVLGMLRPEGSSEGRSLPEGVAFASDVDTIVGFLNDNGVDPRAAIETAALARRVLENRAIDMTVLVSCWD